MELLLSMYVKLLLVCFALFSAFFSHAKIRASVSPEFPDGLHRQYLQYMADKLGMELDIHPMPLARRIRQFENGKLDILVGMIKRKKNEDKHIYLQPGYEQLPVGFFVLQENRDKLVELANLNDLIVGVTNGSEFFNRVTRSNVTTVELNSLSQKIGLLLKGRIGAFVHYRQSTMSKLINANLEKKIVLAQYQSDVYESHHYVINEDSSLYPVKNKLEQIIMLGLKEGDFKKIRQRYYQNKL